MSPSFVSRLQWLTGEVDRARHLADDRISAVLGRLEARGVSASGRRGDELPMTAFDDALAQFAADHIVIGLRVPASEAWQRHNVVDRLLDRFRLPITVFAIGSS